MIKKTITYEDFDGNERTEDFYFNLNQTEILELTAAENGTLADRLDFISKSNNPSLILPAFKEIIGMAYGVRSEDGKYFRKSKEAFDDFCATEAYSELFMSFLTDAEGAAEFINGLMPKQLDETISKLQGQADQQPQRKAPQDYKKKADHEGSIITDVPSITDVQTVAPPSAEEIQNLSREELVARLEALKQP